MAVYETTALIRVVEKRGNTFVSTKLRKIKTKTLSECFSTDYTQFNGGSRSQALFCIHCLATVPLESLTQHINNHHKKGGEPCETCRNTAGIGAIPVRSHLKSKMHAKILQRQRMRYCLIHGCTINDSHSCKGIDYRQLTTLVYGKARDMDELETKPTDDDVERVDKSVANAHRAGNNTKACALYLLSTGERTKTGYRSKPLCKRCLEYIKKDPITPFINEKSIKSICSACEPFCHKGQTSCVTMTCDSAIVDMLFSGEEKPKKEFPPFISFADATKYPDYVLKAYEVKTKAGGFVLKKGDQGNQEDVEVEAGEQEEAEHSGRRNDNKQEEENNDDEFREDQESDADSDNYDTDSGEDATEDEEEEEIITQPVEKTKKKESIPTPPAKTDKDDDKDDVMPSNTCGECGQTRIDDKCYNCIRQRLQKARAANEEKAKSTKLSASVVDSVKDDAEHDTKESKRRNVFDDVFDETPFEEELDKGNGLVNGFKSFFGWN